MAKQIRIRCPANVAQLIIDALRGFIERNYPVGADECSIAARDALYDLVGRLESELLPHGEISYSIRMRAFLCEAARSYLVLQGLESGTCFDNRCKALVAICRGEADGADFDAAAERDARFSTSGDDRGSVE